MMNNLLEIAMVASCSITMLFGIWGIILIVKAIATIWKRPEKKCHEARALREEIAAFCHDFQWSGWMRYLFKIGTLNDDGTWTMPKWAVDRWTRQADTLYNDLPENQKENDRREADRILELMK